MSVSRRMIREKAKARLDSRYIGSFKDIVIALTGVDDGVAFSFARVLPMLEEDECDVSYEQDGIPRCSVCENVLYDEYKKGDGIKNYCDECGAKVRKAVKR